MNFEEALTRATEMLRRHGRVSLRALKRQLELADDVLADLRDELVAVRDVATDDGKGVLTWKGEAAVAVREPAPARPREQESERRQLTVMFCDLVDSTVLSERLDPEQLSEVYGVWQDEVVQVMRRFGGHVAEYRGDGVFVYFGYPVALEDAAQRAILAALQVLAQLESVNARLAASHGVKLTVRIGIHTGLVLLSDFGGRYARDRFALGETPNVAARVQALAGPNEIALSGATRSLARKQFEFRALGEQALKGLSRPIHVYLVEGVVRTHAGERAGASFVARAAELALLADRWERAVQAESRVVMIGGEAGIGKSRLLGALRDIARAGGARRITLRCLSYHSASALYPVIEHLHRFLRLQPGEPDSAKLAKLRAALGAAQFDVASHLPLFAALLSLPAQSALGELTPQQVRARTVEALVRWFVLEAREQPLLLSVEDLHWADPSTLELLHLLIDEMAGVRMLLVTTARPEFRAPWPNRSHISQVTLGRLSDAESEELVRSLARGRDLPARVLAQVLARADGMPLFIEELLAATADAANASASEIPHTLQGSLMARLDRLPQARDVAQLAAAIGREFTREIIEAVGLVAPAAIDAGIAQLLEQELLQRRTTAAGLLYRFRHALIRDAAHESMLRSRRALYHRRIAEILAERFRGTPHAEPEVLAQHWAEGNETQRAIDAWHEAADRALARWANIEALNHLERALAALAGVPAGPERAQQELKLEIKRGAALLIVHGQSALVVERAYRRAGDLALGMGDSHDLHPALLGLWRYYIGRAELDPAREVAEKLFGLAGRMGDAAMLIDAHMTLGVTLYHAWEMPRALELIEECVRRYEAPQGASAASRVAIGQHSGLGSVLGTAYIYMLQGRRDEAYAALERAQRIAQELAAPFQICNALSWGALLMQVADDIAEFRRYAVPAMALAEQHNFPIWLTAGKCSLGQLRVLDGAHAEGLALIRESLRMVDEVGYGMFRTRAHVVLAEAYRVAGRIDEGLEVAQIALSVLPRGSERWWEPEIHRVRGALLAEGGRTAEAAAAFRCALEIGRARGLHLFADRAERSLAAHTA